MATPREVLQRALAAAIEYKSGKTYGDRADKVVDALDAYLSSRGDRTMRDRVLTAVTVTYAECRTAGGGGDPREAGLMRRREEALELLLNDGWVLDRLAGLVERG